MASLIFALSPAAELKTWNFGRPSALSWDNLRDLLCPFAQNKIPAIPLLAHKAGHYAFKGISRRPGFCVICCQHPQRSSIRRRAKLFGGNLRRNQGAWPANSQSFRGLQPGGL